MMIKKIFILSFSVVGILGMAQKTIFTQAKIDEVELYQNVALLKNKVSVNVPKGNSEIVIANITNELMKETVQVGTDTKGISILSNRHTDDYESAVHYDATHPEIKKKLDSLAVIDNRIKKVKIELETTKKAVELLDKNQNILVGSNSPNVNQLSDLTNYYQKKRIELLLKQNELKDELDKLTNDNKRISNTLKKEESRFEKASGDGFIVLRINSEKAGMVNFKVNYLVEDVSWSPIYEINANTNNQSLSMNLKAAVKQNSKIDWENVKLVLISSYYRRYNTAPTIYPWILQYTNVDDRVQRTYNEVQKTPVKESKPLIASSYSKSVNMLNTSFENGIRYDIRSNNEEHLIDLEKQNVNAEFMHYAVPSFSSDAYLVANIKNFEKYNFIDAKAKIMVDGMYVGDTSINTDQVEEDLKITLGSDPRVSVSKVYVEKNNSDKFLSNNEEKVRSYDLVISNKKQEKITIEVKDRYPISEEKDIKIELVESSGAKVDKEKHILTWTKQIKPSEVIKLRVTYRIKHPKDFNITHY